MHKLHKFLKKLRLIHEFSIINLKLRYEGSFMGVLWFILMPVFLFSILFIVFSQNIGRDIENYPLYVLTGIVIWNFFSRFTNDGLKVFSTYNNIMQKVSISKSRIFLSVLLKNIYSFLIEIVILVIVLYLFFEPFFNFFFLSLLFLSLFIFTYAVGLLLSLLNAKFRDIENIWRIVLFGGWFLTPVFFDRGIVGNKIGMFLMDINPLTHILELFRNSMLSDYNNWLLLFVLLCFSIIVMLFMQYIFSIFSKKVVDFI